MQAKDLMTPVVTCLAPETRIQEVAQTMKSMDIGFVPVCEKDRLVGTVTDRDIVLRAVAEGKDLQRCTARDLMTSKVLWCYDDQSAEEVARYMSHQEVRRVVVLDRSKRLVGVISIGDLAKRGDQNKAGQAIRDIAEAPPANAAA
jgi:CBS domain-containing protein